MTLPHLSRAKVFCIGRFSLAVLLLCGGCVYRHAYTLPATYKFAIQCPHPEQHFIRVPRGGDYPVPPDGRVTVSYYEARKSCEVRFMDAVLLHAESGKVKTLYVMKGSRVMKKIALEPPEDFVLEHSVDDQGYYTVRLEQE